MKNIETGESENSRDLVKEHHSLLLDAKQNDKLWKNYHNSIKKMKDKLLELIIRKNNN